MKPDHSKTKSPVNAMGHALWDWTWSKRGMPLKVSLLGATMCLAATFGISVSLGKTLDPDEVLKEEQMKACRLANQGLSDREMTDRNFKCVSVHPGPFAP